NINSEYDEVTPVIAPDGKTLYFDRKHHPLNTGTAKNDDIWYSELDYKFEWQPAKNMGAPLNNANHNFLCSISSDGNKILLGNNYGETVDGQPGISMAIKQQDGWSIPHDLFIDNFINLNEYNEFCLSADGQVLLMSIETESGLGQKDIFVSFMRKENIWSEPINLGNRINTAGNEMSPYIAADNITLYYSTNGWPGYGGQDIFISRRLDNTWLNWSEPINIGPDINTEGWDAYYTVDALGSYAYFTSNNETKGDLDIYRIRLPDSLKPEPVLLFTGNAFNKATNEKITATLTYFALDAYGSNGSSTATPYGAFGVYLLKGSKYLISLSAEGYFDQMAELDLTQVQKLYTLNNNFYLIPKEKGTVIQLNNIEFNANSAVLDAISYTELYKVVELLQANPEVTIEIRGHTNGLCEENYCNALSERRAQSVAQYLIDNGIAASRVTYKGYGKQFPIADDATPEGRQKNQRVEFMITGING
ncbi:MAG: OmpA family protein, partial [Chitinophagales bacterium]